MSAATEWTNQWTQFLGSFAEHRELSEVWMKGTGDFSALNPAETVQFSSHLGRIFRVGENIYDQFEQGMFDPKAWRGVILTGTLRPIGHHVSASPDCSSNSNCCR